MTPMACRRRFTSPITASPWNWRTLSSRAWVLGELPTTWSPSCPAQPVLSTTGLARVVGAGEAGDDQGGEGEEHQRSLRKLKSYR